MIDHDQYIFHIWCNITNDKLHSQFRKELVEFIQSCRGDDLFFTGEEWLTKAAMVKEVFTENLKNNIDEQIKKLARLSFLEEGIQKLLIFTDTNYNLQTSCKHTCQASFFERKFKFLQSKISIQIWSLKPNQYDFTQDIHFPLSSFEHLGEILKGEHGEVSRSTKNCD